MSALYRSVPLDESEPLLAMSYRMRYQTFCLEQLFLDKDQYPRQLESDAFDRASVHVGVLDGHNALVGSARVVHPGSAGLPLLRHCVLYRQETVLDDPANRVVELSRVCLNNRWDRRAAARPMAPAEDRRSRPSLPPLPPPGREATDPLATLIKGMYQATKRLSATHWIVAIEKSLRRRIVRYGLPFRQVGPEVDYHGPVAPYVMSLGELDDLIRSRRYPVLQDFAAGLEPSSLTGAGIRMMEESLR